MGGGFLESRFDLVDLIDVALIDPDRDLGTGGALKGVVLVLGLAVLVSRGEILASGSVDSITRATRSGSSGRDLDEYFDNPAGAALCCDDDRGFLSPLAARSARSARRWSRN